MHAWAHLRTVHHVSWGCEPSVSGADPGVALRRHDARKAPPLQARPVQKPCAQAQGSGGPSPCATLRGLARVRSLKARLAPALFCCSALRRGICPRGSAQTALLASTHASACGRKAGGRPRPAGSDDTFLGGCATPLASPPQARLRRLGRSRLAAGGVSLRRPCRWLTVVASQADFCGVDGGCAHATPSRL